VIDIQDRHHALLQRAAKATTDMLDAIVAAKSAGVPDGRSGSRGRPAQEGAALDFVAAENSMGFHAPRELARVLGETIDLGRQGQLEAERAGRRK
jgi:nitrite reductase (cytochrome c-552)